MNVISLFSGAGGLDLGFKNAGANIVWANDIDKDAVETYKLNLDNNIICEDIKKINPEDIPDADVIIGGFPCLGFTVAKGKSRDICDFHNFLYLEYLRITKAKNPKLFLIENVPGIKRGLSFKEFFNRMISEFEELGYTVNYKTLRASNYGVPQNRDRVIIVGIRNDLDYNFEFPLKTHEKEIKTDIFGETSKNLITIRDAISDLPEDWDENIPNHIGTKHKVKITGYIGNRKLDWDKPSPTIMGRGSKGGGPVIHPHPNLKRRLTIRECARLQSFPDNFIFLGSNSSQYAQIGNAVAPLFAFKIAQKVMESMGEIPNKYNEKDWDLPYNTKI